MVNDGRGPIRVLVAEDDDLVRSLIERLLTMQGWQVVAVENGVEAVAAWEAAGGFDLGILDVRMPRMNGYDAYLSMRRISPAARFLFVSGYAEEEIERRLVEGERLPFMAKPFDSDALLERVYALLGQDGRRPLYGAY
ncbi:MAG: response regulator [Chloroflexi bacterium]|nr:response regulator [Chloroflexota bacterium]